MASGLRIQLESVNNYTKTIKSCNTFLTKEFDSLENTMKTLSSAWQDDVGSQYISQFNGFIAKSKDINNDLSKLITDINNCTGYYSSVLKNALSMMR